MDPQRAYVLSQEISDWGGGNSWTNSLYFISTQESSGDICPAQGGTPEGIFLIQDVGTGNYITLSSDSSLAAVGAVDALATKFELSYKPGGGNLKALSNGKYVSADTSGANSLTASKDTASGYELFRWYLQPDGTYHLRAQSNKGLVGTKPDGELVNDGSNSLYRLTPSNTNPPPPLPQQGKLRNLQTNDFVLATADNPTLHVGSSEGDATIWAFERVAESPDSAPQYGIRSTTTNSFVTGNPAGNEALKAGSGGAGAWEYFQFLPYNNDGYIIIHTVSGLSVAAQPDGTLVDNDLNIDLSAIWTIM